MFFFGKEQKSEENALFGFFDNLGCLVPNAKNGLKYFVKYSFVFTFQASPNAVITHSSTAGRPGTNRDKGRSKCPGTNSSVPGRPGTK
jgi:hypothetical protein